MLTPGHPGVNTPFSAHASANTASAPDAVLVWTMNANTNLQQAVPFHLVVVC